MRLSIITINRNNARGLQATIDSVAAQTWNDFQYIVVDGASQDGSKSVIEEQRQYIDSWISEPDQGIYDAQNKGISMAKGEYCLFLNSGDFLYSPLTLAEVFAHQLTEDIVYGDLILASKNGRTRHVVYPKVLEFDFLRDGTLPHQASFIKRGLLIEAGFYSLEYLYISDWVFFIDAIFRRNCSYRHVDVVVASYDTSGITSRKESTVSVRTERLAYLQKTYTNLCRGLENQDSYVAIRYCKRHRSSKLLRIVFGALSKCFALYRRTNVSLRRRFR